MVEYDSEVRQRKLVRQCWLAFATFIAASFAFAYAWRLYVGPYRAFLTTRTLEHEKAVDYLTTTACTSAEKRARLEGWNLCEKSRIAANLDPSEQAFNDLMQYLKLCDQGACYIFGYNVSDIGWGLGKFVMSVLVALLLLSSTGIGAAMYGLRSRGTDLPFQAYGMYMQQPPPHQYGMPPPGYYAPQIPPPVQDAKKVE